MDKDVVHIYNGILLSHKKEGKMPFAATWMDLEVIIRSEVTKKKTNIIQYHLHVESKNKDRNELIYKTVRDHRHRKTNLSLPKGKGGRRDKLTVSD